MNTHLDDYFRVSSDHFKANCIFEAKANNWLESTIQPVAQVKLVQIPDMHYSQSLYFCKLLKNITEELFVFEVKITKPESNVLNLSYIIDTWWQKIKNVIEYSHTRK